MSSHPLLSVTFIDYWQNVNKCDISQTKMFLEKNVWGLCNLCGWCWHSTMICVFKQLLLQMEIHLTDSGRNVKWWGNAIKFYSICQLSSWFREVSDSKIRCTITMNNIKDWTLLETFWMMWEHNSTTLLYTTLNSPTYCRFWTLNVEIL